MREFAEHIVACNGIQLKDAVKDSRYLELNHKDENGKKNVNIYLNKFVTNIYKLDKRYKDLLEIAAYIFAADRRTYRGKPDDNEYHSWSRSFNFHITVRDYNFWNSPEVKELLEEALLFMSGDHSYKFTFYKSGKDFPTSIFDDEKFTVDRPDNLKVVLFSGGIDSLAGVIELLETTDSEICLVSHQTGLPGVQTTQKGLYNEIKRLYPERCKHYKFRCGLSNTPSRDETQRTRSFLYTSIAFALAREYNQDSIYVYENGITSINFAETQDLMNGRASRTTHPQTIRKLEELFTVIGEKQFSIQHPYLYKTKTDVVEVLKTHKRIALLNSSVSCSTTRNKAPGTTHCGVCSQCIDRRFAVYAAEAEKYDNTGLYHFDFLEDNLEKDAIKKLLTEYIRLAQSFTEQNIDEWYEERGSEIIDIIDFIDGSSEIDRLEKLYNLCRRHSEHIEKSIKRMRDLHDPPYKHPRPKSFFSLIIGPRVYQQETDQNKSPSRKEKGLEKEVPSKGLKKLAKEACENLIKQGKITDVLTETKAKRNISSLVVEELKKKRYKITKRNENTISDYFRKYELQLAKERNGKLVVIENRIKR